MPDVTNILIDTPVQIATYDSTNDELFFGYLAAKNINLTQRPLYHKTIEGHRVQYGTRTMLKFQTPETDPTKIASLQAREGIKQTIYITAFNYGVKISETYITHFQKRAFEFGGETVLQVEAHTDVEADCEVIKNLLSSVKDGDDFGGFEVDGGGGLGDGWTSYNGPTVSLTDPSFLNGAGNNHQDLDMVPSEGIRLDVPWFIDQPVVLTFSVNVKGAGAGTHSMRIRMDLLDNGSTSRANTSDVISITDTDQSRESLVWGVTPPAAYDIEYIRCLIEAGSGNADIQVDDAQMEFGSLSDYTEND